MEKDENDFNLTPPNPLRVAGRALVLSAVTCRGFIEQEAGDKNAEAFREDVLNWLCDLVLKEEIEREEFSLLNSPLGTLTPKQTIDATWRSEGMAVLAWALGKIEMPLYDQMVDPQTVAESLGFMKDQASTSLYSPRLQSSADLRKFDGLMFSLHWRLRQFSLDHAPMNFIEVARTCWFGPLETAGLRFIENDLAIGEKAIGEASEGAFRECLSVAQERHLAANWLLGYGEVYSEVSTDT
jgi:hypothetical protein